MKQESPLHKKQNYVATEKHFTAIIERSVAATARKNSGIAACRRHTDAPCDDASQCWEPCGELGRSEEHMQVFRSCEGLGQIYEAPQDSTPQPIKDVAKGLVTGMGLAASVFAMVLLFLGSDPLWYAIWAVLCLFGWLWLDASNDE